MANDEQDLPATIMTLLIGALDKEARSADIKRLYEYRSALLLLDFQDESATVLKQLLLRCAMNPLFLRTSEGKKFLIYLFGVHLPFIDQLHLTIKAQLPICPKSLLDAYGEIYFRAWKVAQGPYLLKIEYNCIQDLMSQAVHVANPTVSTALSKLLEFLHQQKKQRGVDEMLARLYEPILWRALKVANANVRKNASILLFDAFPLIQPDSSKREMDQLLQKQFDQMHDLLFDPAPIVRSVAVKGVCRILGVFWELIPTATINVLLSALIKDLVRDKSSSIVRASVFEGLKYLLENHLSQPSLKALLPQLTNLIHDHSDRVRASFVDLLCEIKKSRIIRFYDIVPVEHLLARLATDSPPLAKRLTDLLLSSYFPTNRDKAVQAERCTLLLKANKEAAFVFYSHVHSLVPVLSLCNFVAVLNKVLHKSAQDTSTDSELGNHREDILHVMVTVWASIAGQLDKKTNKAAKQYMLRKFNDKTFEGLYSSFTSEQGQQKVLNLASYVPREAIPQFSSECVRKLQMLTGRDESERYEALLGCLFAWKKGEQILSLILRCISIGVGDTEEDATQDRPNYARGKRKQESGRGKGKKKRKVDADGEVGEDQTAGHLDQREGPLIGLELLGAVMEKDVMRDDIFNHHAMLRDIVDNLEAYFVLLCSRVLPDAVSGKDNEEEGPVVQPVKDRESEGILLLTLSGLTKIIIHFLARGDEWRERGEELLASILMWAEQSLLPLLAAPNNLDEDEIVLEATMENIAIGLSEAVVLGLCPSSLLNQAISLFQSLLLLQNRQGFLQTVAVPLTSRMVYQLYHEGGEEAQGLMLLSHALNSLSPAQLMTLRGLLSEIFTLQHHRGSLSLFLSPLVNDILLDQLVIPSVFPSGLVDSVEDFPGGQHGKAALLVGSIGSSSSAISALAEYLNRFLAENSADEQQRLGALWKVLDTISIVSNETGRGPNRLIRPNLAPLQNCLMNILAKSRPSPALQENDTLTEGVIFQSASSLLNELESLCTRPQK